MLDHALLLKHYPRQNHTQIEIVYSEGSSCFEGRNTEVLVYGAMASTLFEVNRYQTPEHQDPYDTQLFISPNLHLRVYAAEDVVPTLQGAYDHKETREDTKAVDDNKAEKSSTNDFEFPHFNRTDKL